MPAKNLLTQILIAPRQTGKTYAALKRMSEDENLLYVTSTMQQAVMAWRMAGAFGWQMDRSRFLSAEVRLEEKLHEHYHNRRYLVVDNADHVLSYLLGAPLAMVTFTGGDEEERELAHQKRLRLNSAINGLDNFLDAGEGAEHVRLALANLKELQALGL